MEKLRKWIRKNGNVKNFIENVRISRSFFSAWETGKKRMGLHVAYRIVHHTNGYVSYDDIVHFENYISNIDMSKGLKNQGSQPSDQKE